MNKAQNNSSTNYHNGVSFLYNGGGTAEGLESLEQGMSSILQHLAQRKEHGQGLKTDSTL